jgi:fructose-specific PTS system IIB component
MSKVLFRIDDRLIHGQVVVGWVRFMEASKIIVANDLLAEDETQKMLYKMVATSDLGIEVLPVEEAARWALKRSAAERNTIFLFENPADVLRFAQLGVPMTSINIGGMRASKGKHQVHEAVFVDKSDYQVFHTLKAMGINIEIRMVPNDPSQDLMQRISEIIKSWE